MKKNVICGLMVAGFSLLVGGCGGGGNTPPPPTTAILTLTTAGTPSGVTKGIELTVNLPASVSVKTDPLNPKQTAPGALKLSGVYASYSTLTVPRPFWGRYSSAGAGKPSVVKVNIQSATANYPAGEFATLTCDLVSGQTVSLTDFSVVNFAAYGTGGADVTGLTASPLGVILK